MAVLFPSGCSQCDDYAAASLSVTVEDASGRAVCDATVIAESGGDRFPLEPVSDCAYAGPWERPGTYVVTATSGNEFAESAAIDVAIGACHVKGATVRLVLG